MFFFVSTLLRDCSLCWDCWDSTWLLHLTRPCLCVVHRNRVEPLALGRVLIWVEHLNISMNVQPCSLHTQITHVCGWGIIAKSYYIANSFYVTMPQAGFEPHRGRSAIQVLKLDQRFTSKPPRLGPQDVYLGSKQLTLKMYCDKRYYYVVLSTFNLPRNFKKLL